MAKQLWSVSDDGVLQVNLHPGQAKAWASTKRFVVVLAGTQGGKTSFGPLWLHREIQQRGPGDYLAVTASFPLLDLKMLPEFLRFFRDTLHLGEWRETKHSFVFTEEGQRLTFGHKSDIETRVIFGSAVNPDSLESATAKGAWVDEAGQDKFRVNAWEAILRRLSLNRGRAFVGTTPYNLGWVKTRLYDRWVKGDPDIDLIQFSSTMNPSFSDEEYEWAKANLPEWRFRLFYDGQFAKPAGLIYADYWDLQREVGGHLVQPFPLPTHWERYGGVDFGATNQAVLAMARDQKEDLYYIYHVANSGGKTTPEYVAEVSRDLSLSYLPFEGWWGGTRSEVQQRRDWTDAGIPVEEPPFYDVEAGIDRVVRLFKTNRCFVFDTLTELREDLGNYRRKLDEEGQPMEDIDQKSKWHRLDALRYCVAGATDAEYFEPASENIALAFGFARRRLSL